MNYKNEIRYPQNNGRSMPRPPCCKCNDNARTAESIADCVDSLPLAMAYVPRQAFRDLYDPESGLCHGTIFRELYLPFLGASCNQQRKEFK